jgi:peptide/nickel transport system substrate-binding protein
MKRTWSRRTALSSALLLAMAAAAATRPHYGGVLRIGIAERIATLDPAEHDGNAGARIARLRITPLIFETLVRQQPDGSLRPGLARYWTSGPNFRRWQFWLRAGVIFHDGVALTPEVAAKSLAGVITDCTARASGEMLVLDCQSPHPALAAELAMPEHAIVRRTAANTIEGTGPFVVSQWRAGERAVLSAWDEYWGGRPYVDTLEITLGQPERDQLLALQLGRTDVVELAPGEAARAGLRTDIRSNARISISPPIELLALNFAHSSKAVADPRVRAAINFLVDRDAIAAKLLQREAQPAATLVPGWISGYGAAFSAAADSQRAGELLAQARQPSGAPLAPITLQYDAADPLSRLIAERIAVDAREIGLPLQTAGAPGGAADVVLEHLAISSLDPAAALMQVAAELRLPAPAIADDALESVYRAESALLNDRWVVPVVFVKRSWAVAPRVRNWMLPPDGRWHADDLWVQANAEEERQ